MDQYHIARTTKDKNFDGQFFFGVKTTGIFCRPSCPSPVAKEENVIYFDTMFDALHDGFRPCHRCRPDIEVEYYSGNIDGVNIVNTALEKIYDGFLNTHSVSELAEALFVSDRHLRKLFVENLGSSPIKIAKYHKSIFAKKLLLYSKMPITEVAFASGFRSIRQFNDVFKDLFSTTPSQYRKEVDSKWDDSGVMTIHVPYQKPFDYMQVLQFMKDRLIKGVEVVNGGQYSRTFCIDGIKGYFTVEDDPGDSFLILKIVSSDVRCCMALYNKVRKMFDIDTDISLISSQLSEDHRLAKGMRNMLAPRLPVAFDPFEFMIRAIVGQQISVSAATTLASRIVERGALETDDTYPSGLDYFFPDIEHFNTMSLEELGITKTRVDTIVRVVEKLLDQDLSLSYNQSYSKFHSDFSAIKGIGDWTVQYVAMRGLGMVDSFPSKDLGIIKALTIDNIKPKVGEIEEISKTWKPYRAYAALCLWNGTSMEENN